MDLSFSSFQELSVRSWRPVIISSLFLIGRGLSHGLFVIGRVSFLLFVIIFITLLGVVLSCFKISLGFLKLRFFFLEFFGGSFMSFTSLFSISSYFFNFLLLLLFFSFSFLFMFSFNFILLLLFGFLIRFSLGLLLLFCLSFLLLLLIILDFLITGTIIRFSLGLSSLLLNLLFSRHLLV